MMYKMPRLRKQSIFSATPTIAFLLLLCMVTLFLFGAQRIPVLAAQETQKVYDYYGLFSSDEIQGLEDTCTEYGDEGKVDIVMVTTKTLDGKSDKKYLEDFYDANGFGYDKEFGDTVIMLVNLEEGNRLVTIQGYGNAEYYVNNDRIEYMLDDIITIIQNGNYLDAFEEFAVQSAYYMNEETGVKATPANPDATPGSGGYYGESSYDGPSNYYGQNEDNILYNTFVQLAIALVIGGITVGVMVANSGGRVTTNNRTYLDEQHSGLVDKRDDYIRTTTTRVKKPSQNQNNGGGRSSGGGGISSGGHSHSGGSRSF